MNAEIKNVREARAKWEDADCRDDLAMPCPILTLTLDIVAQKLVLVLDGAAKPGVPAFIGKPPAEVEKLVADTRVAAQRVDDVIHDAGKAEPSELAFAVGQLLRQFDRWEPYI